MQLFLTEWVGKNNEISLSDERVFHQMKTVLRAKEWTEFFVQKNSDEQNVVRMKVRIKTFDEKKNIVAEIVSEEEKKNNEKNIKICLAMPNKFDKCELMTQKLSEIWVTEIVFWVAERSQIRELNQQKLDRLKKIAIEAVEQSRGWKIPVISFEKNCVFQLSEEKNFCCIFDAGDQSFSTLEISGEMSNVEKIIWIVWPEWGFSPKDYENFPKNAKIVNLGERILRMETAAIVGSRLLKNLSRW